MKKSVFAVLAVLLSISVLSGCGDAATGEKIGSSSKKAGQTAQSAREGSAAPDDTGSGADAQTGTDTKPGPGKTQSGGSSRKPSAPLLKNNPKYVRCDVAKAAAPGKGNAKGVGFRTEPPAVRPLSLTAETARPAYREYVEQADTVQLKLCIANPERDTIIDVLLNDTQEGENCLYSSSSSVFKISSIDTLWDKTAATYYTYVTILLSPCKGPGERAIEILEINFLRQIIDQRISGSVDMSVGPSQTEFAYMALKKDHSIEFTDEGQARAADSFTLKFLLHDPDKSISKLTATLYQGGKQVAKKELAGNASQVQFGSLTPLTEYTVKLEWNYDRLEAGGSKTKSEDFHAFTTLKGAGTAQNPFEIRTADDFIATSGEKFYVPNAYFKLMADIDFKGSAFDFFGKYELGDQYTLDGNGKALKNIAIQKEIPTRGGEPDYAFFGLYSKCHGAIKNLRLENIRLSLTSSAKKINIGGFSGWAGTITGCFISGEIRWKPVGSVNPADCFVNPYAPLIPGQGDNQPPMVKIERE